MIFCFDPPIKLSVLKKTGLSTETILGNSRRYFNSTSAIYEEGNYNLHEDFELNIKESEKFHLKQIHYTVEPIYTMLNGKCHKLTFHQTLKGRLIKQIISYFHINRSFFKDFLQF